MAVDGPACERGGTGGTPSGSAPGEGLTGRDDSRPLSSAGSLHTTIRMECRQCFTEHEFQHSVVLQGVAVLAEVRETGLWGVLCKGTFRERRVSPHADTKLQEFCFLCRYDEHSSQEGRRGGRGEGGMSAGCRTAGFQVSVLHRSSDLESKVYAVRRHDESL